MLEVGRADKSLMVYLMRGLKLAQSEQDELRTG